MGGGGGCLVHEGGWGGGGGANTFNNKERVYSRAILDTRSVIETSLSHSALCCSFVLSTQKGVHAHSGSGGTPGLLLRLCVMLAPCRPSHQVSVPGVVLNYP